jgi:hypothetical protein
LPWGQILNLGHEDFMLEKAAGVCASVFQPLSADEEHQQEHAPRLD